MELFDWCGVGVPWRKDPSIFPSRSLFQKIQPVFVFLNQKYFPKKKIKSKGLCLSRAPGYAGVRRRKCGQWLSSPLPTPPSVTSWCQTVWPCNLFWGQVLSDCCELIMAPLFWTVLQGGRGAQTEEGYKHSYLPKSGRLLSSPTWLFRLFLEKKKILLASLALNEKWRLNEIKLEILTVDWERWSFQLST